MAVKPVKPNETGGKKGGIKVGKPVPDTGLRRPLIKSNVRNAPLGGGGKLRAIQDNGGIGGGNNLTPAGKMFAKRNPPRQR